MKFFLISSIAILILFAGITTYLTTKSGRTIQDIKSSRDEVNRISALATDIDIAETQLAELTPEKRQKLQNSLPSPFDVANKIAALATKHGASVVLTPLGGAVGTGTQSGPQELQASLKIQASNSQSVQSFVKDLEEGALFVTIKNFSINTMPSGQVDATIGIGVFIQ